MGHLWLREEKEDDTVGPGRMASQKQRERGMVACPRGKLVKQVVKKLGKVFNNRQVEEEEKKTWRLGTRELSFLGNCTVEKGGVGA